MKRAIVGITAGLILALILSIYWGASEATTGILTVLSVSVYKAYRVLSNVKN